MPDIKLNKQLVQVQAIILPDVLGVDLSTVLHYCTWNDMDNSDMRWVYKNLTHVDCVCVCKVVEALRQCRLDGSPHAAEALARLG